MSRLLAAKKNTMRYGYIFDSDVWMLLKRYSANESLLYFIQ